MKSLSGREKAIVLVGIIGGIIAIAGFIYLPDSQGLGVASVGMLIAVACIFLLRVRAEPAIGTNDAPQVSRALTGGEGRATATFLRYDPAPGTPDPDQPMAAALRP
jgi:hypothetical protein